MKDASHQRPHPVLFHLYEMSRIGKSTETESRSAVARSWEAWGTLMDTGFGGGGGKN